jgi:prefoldin subunit 5
MAIQEDNPQASRIAQRIAALRQEKEAVQAQLSALEARKHELANLMLRINGAIAVLEEMEAEGRTAGDQGAQL